MIQPPPFAKHRLDCTVYCFCLCTKTLFRALRYFVFVLSYSHSSSPPCPAPFLIFCLSLSFSFSLCLYFSVYLSLCPIDTYIASDINRSLASQGDDYEDNYHNDDDDQHNDDCIFNLHCKTQTPRRCYNRVLVCFSLSQFVVFFWKRFTDPRFLQLQNQ